MPFWLFMGPLVVGSLLLVVETAGDVRAHVAAPASRRKADGAELTGRRDGRLPRRRRLPRAVHARLSGRARDRHPVHRLHLRQRPADRPDRAAHALRARLVSAGRRAGVPVRRQPDEQRGHLALHLPVRRHRGRPPAGRPRAGEHLRQPDLRRHVGLGAGRHRRHRPHRDRRDAQQGLQARLRRRGDELVGDRRADLPAVDSADHLRHRHRRVGDPAAAGRHPARPAVRGDADADDRLARGAAQLSARGALADVRRAVARLQAGVSGDRGAGDPDRRDAARLLHADRDRVGDRALRDADQQPVLSRAHGEGSARRRVRDDPRVGRASC